MRKCENSRRELREISPLQLVNEKQYPCLFHSLLKWITEKEKKEVELWLIHGWNEPELHLFLIGFRNCKKKADLFVVGTVFIFVFCYFDDDLGVAFLP